MFFVLWLLKLGSYFIRYVFGMLTLQGRPVVVDRDKVISMDIFIMKKY